MLSDRERSYLRGLRWRRRVAVAVGMLLIVVGGFYGIWGAGQFRSRLDVEVGEERSASIRDPVARLALLFAPYQDRLREAEPETEAERVLLAELGEQTAISAQLLVLLVRFLFASLVLTGGLILFASGMGTKRLLTILDSLLEQQNRGERGPGG
jgi:hypothetical protein